MRSNILRGGTWTAVHAGTPIIVLHLRWEKGELVGAIQVCSYSVNTETTVAVDVVTDPTLSKNLPINNVKVSGKVQPIPVNKNIPKSRWVAKPPPCQNQLGDYLVSQDLPLKCRQTVLPFFFVSRVLC